MDSTVKSEHFRLKHADTSQVVIQFVHNAYTGRTSEAAVKACEEFGITIPPGQCFIEKLMFFNSRALWQTLPGSYRVYSRDY